MSIVKELETARDRLTPETWLQGTLFSHRHGKLCMCAHGAAQTVTNPRLAQLLSDGVMFRWNGKAFVKDTHSNDLGYQYAARLRSCSRDLFFTAAELGDRLRQDRDDFASKDCWESRPSPVRESDTRGTLDIHYLLGMVGLTPFFNDRPDTTLAMVKEKFDQAIALAKRLGL